MWKQIFLILSYIVYKNLPKIIHKEHEKKFIQRELTLFGAFKEILDRRGGTAAVWILRTAPKITDIAARKGFVLTHLAWVFERSVQPERIQGERTDSQTLWRVLD